jgi:hypothetical protein
MPEKTQENISRIRRSGERAWENVQEGTEKGTGVLADVTGRLADLTSTNYWWEMATGQKLLQATGNMLGSWFGSGDRGVSEDLKSHTTEVAPMGGADPQTPVTRESGQILTENWMIRRTEDEAKQPELVR